LSHLFRSPLRSEAQMTWRRYLPVRKCAGPAGRSPACAAQKRTESSGPTLPTTPSHNCDERSRNSALFPPYARLWQPPARSFEGRPHADYLFTAGLVLSRFECQNAGISVGLYLCPSPCCQIDSSGNAKTGTTSRLQGLTYCAGIWIWEGVFVVCLASIEASEILFNQERQRPEAS
jgi:hypothetical protein